MFKPPKNEPYFSYKQTWRSYTQHKMTTVKRTVSVKISEEVYEVVNEVAIKRGFENIEELVKSSLRRIYESQVIKKQNPISRFIDILSKDLVEKEELQEEPY